MSLYLSVMYVIIEIIIRHNSKSHFLFPSRAIRLSCLTTVSQSERATLLCKKIEDLFLTFQSDCHTMMLFYQGILAQDVVIIVGICSLLALIFVGFNEGRKYRHRTTSAPKPVIVPGGYFLLGHTNQIFPLAEFPRKLLALSKVHGPLFQLRFLGRQFIVCSDPSMAREALMKRPVTFGRPRFFSTQRPFEDGNVFEKKVPAMFGAEG